MVPSRPLLYLTLPSIALLIGLVWFRRKKSSVNCDTGGGSKCTASATKKFNENNPQRPDLKHSQSLPIQLQQQDQAPDIKFGKSAPIDIVPNSRSPPVVLAVDQKIDVEELNAKIRDSEYKTLRAIEEQEDFDSISPIDLPGSDERKNFIFSPNRATTEPAEEPVIIKATMVAKVSPKNSFLENKYTEDDRDSANHSPIDDHISEPTISSALTTTLSSHHQQQQQQKQQNKTTEHIDNSENDHNEMNQPPPPVASPPLSLCSHNSSDSGKGSSPSHSEGAPAITYEFLIPQSLVGHIIGRKGSYVNQVKSKTGANVIVKNHPDDTKVKVCAIEGTQIEIDAALAMIRSKLPEKKYPKVTLERVYVTRSENIVPIPTFDTSCLHLNLVEGINNDVVISAILSGGHIFLQQPLHPSFPSLNILQNCMYQSYSIGESPTLPESVEDVICVANVDGAWYRVQIVSHNPETKSCLVRYLDFGGFCSLSANDLRQIRTDFMTVPFQAIECLLSNIKPAGLEWSPAAVEVLRSLTQGLVLQAQVAGYTTEGLPEIYLYACLGPDNVIFINQELVARGLAEWIEMTA